MTTRTADTSTLSGLYGVLVSYPARSRRERAADAAHSARLEANRQASYRERGLPVGTTAEEAEAAMWAVFS